MASRPEPAAEGLVGEDDVVVLGEDVGEVAEIELGVGGGQVDDLLLQLGERAVSEGPCGVAVDEALGAKGEETAFEAQDLSGGQAQGQGGLLEGQASSEEGFAGFIALDLVQGEFDLRVVHARPPWGWEAARYGSEVTFSLWC
jgi:hypothetical protein